MTSIIYRPVSLKKKIIYSNHSRVFADATELTNCIQLQQITVSKASTDKKNKNTNVPFI